MRITVNSAKCQGHALCVMNAPELIGSSDDDGHAYVLKSEVPTGLETAARMAVEGCPESAIAIEELNQ